MLDCRTAVLTMSVEVKSSTVVDPEQTDSMRAHWAKCQAHAERYKEEAKLVVEEMGQTLHYFD